MRGRSVLILLGVVALGMPAVARAAPSGMDIAATEGASFTGTVVTGLVCPLASATIAWGDGTSSAGTDDGAQGIQGTHTYAEEGTYTGTVSFTYQPFIRTCPTGAQTASFQASVADATLTASPRDVTGTAAEPLSPIVSHFGDANPGATAGDFSARVTWGDGTSTPGSIDAAPGGGFDVRSTHTYANAGSYAVDVAIADVGHAGAQVSSTARIGAAAGPSPAGGGRPVNLTRPFISFSASSNSFVCESGTWQNLPPHQSFAYEWLRRTPGGDVSVVARTRTYGHGGTHGGYVFGCRVTVPGFTGSTIATPDFRRLSPVTVPLSAYGNFRIRGIDVFQVVQPNTCATMFSFPAGAFPCMAGGGTPTAYGPTGRPRPGADPQRTSYVGVNIDADKRTTAVVYLDRTSGENNGNPLEVTLTALSHGRQVGAPLTRRIPGPLPSGSTPWVTAAERGNPSDGVQFQIPARWLQVAARSARGTIDLVARVGFPPGLPHLLAVECNPRELTVKNLHLLVPSTCGSDDVFRLDHLPALHLIALQIRSLELLGNGQGPGSIAPAGPLLTRARQLFPGGERMTVWPYENWIGVRDQETLSATSVPPKAGETPPVWTCNTVRYPNSTSDAATRACRSSAVAAVVRQWDTENPSAGFDATVGVHDYTIPSGGGTTKEPGVTFGSLPIAPPASGAGAPLALINDGTTRPLGATAHEIGHVLGLVHASAACGAGPGGGGETWLPDQIGRLQGVKFDPSAGSPVTPVVDSSTTPQLFDLMTYCGPGATPSDTSPSQTESTLWLSARNWNHAFSTLRTYAGLPGVQTTDRSAPLPAASAAAAGPAFAVGVIGPEGGHIDRVVQPHGHDAIPPSAPNSPVRLRALDAAGHVLADEGAQVQPLLDDPGTATFLAAVPVGSVAVELVSHNIVLDRKQRNRMPHLQLLAPSRHAHARSRGSLLVRWAASDPDNDPLQATVDYSFDGGGSWPTIYQGPSTGRISVPGRFLQGARRARIRVYVNDGFSEAQAISAPFRADGTPPVAQIVRPDRGEPVRPDEPALLIGSAFDELHRPLRGRALTWYAGRRRLGTGERLSATLPAGRVALRLLVRDRRGRRTVLRRVLRVAARTLRLQQLSYPYLVSRRAHTIRARVRANAPATLRIGNRRFQIGRRSRTIVLRLPRRPASGLVALSFQLVARGGRTRAERSVILVVRS